MLISSSIGGVLLTPPHPFAEIMTFSCLGKTFNSRKAVRCFVKFWSLEQAGPIYVPYKAFLCCSFFNHLLCTFQSLSFNCCNSSSPSSLPLFCFCSVYKVQLVKLMDQRYYCPLASLQQLSNWFTPTFTYWKWTKVIDIPSSVHKESKDQKWVTPQTQR